MEPELTGVYALILALATALGSAAGVMAQRYYAWRVKMRTLDIKAGSSAHTALVEELRRQVDRLTVQNDELATAVGDLREQNAILRAENELLRGRIDELEAVVKREHGIDLNGNQAAD